MSTRTVRLSRMRAYFVQHKVATMKALKKCFSVSRNQLFRDLGELGYCRSYNKNGRYYTLATIPEFDEQGLWTFAGKRFSRYGSLSRTLLQWIQAASEGAEAAELSRALGVRVAGCLTALFRRDAVARERYGLGFRYFAVSPSRQRQQRAAWLVRYQREQARRAVNPRLALTVTLELLEHPHCTPADLVERFRSKGIPIPREQVDEIFATLELERKRGRWLKGLRTVQS